MKLKKEYFVNRDRKVVFGMLSTIDKDLLNPKARNNSNIDMIFTEYIRMDADIQSFILSLFGRYI